MTIKKQRDLASLCLSLLYKWILGETCEQARGMNYKENIKTETSMPACAFCLNPMKNIYMAQYLLVVTRPISCSA